MTGIFDIPVAMDIQPVSIVFDFAVEGGAACW